jgi:hypothetical protein
MVQTVMGVTIKQAKVYLLCKSHKYLRLETAWVSFDDMEVGQDYVHRRYLANDLVNKSLIGTVMLRAGHPGPNSALFKIENP